MMQIQSTWFPLIDRNPQKYVTNIFKAERKDYQQAKQTIFFTKRFPTNIELPIAQQWLGGIAEKIRIKYTCGQYCLIKKDKHQS